VQIINDNINAETTMATKNQLCHCEERPGFVPGATWQSRRIDSKPAWRIALAMRLPRYRSQWHI